MEKGCSGRHLTTRRRFFQGTWSEPRTDRYPQHGSHPIQDVRHSKHGRRGEAVWLPTPIVLHGDEIVRYTPGQNRTSGRRDAVTAQGLSPAYALTLNPAVGFRLQAVELLFKTIYTDSGFHPEDELALSADIRLNSYPIAKINGQAARLRPTETYNTGLSGMTARPLGDPHQALARGQRCVTSGS